MNYNDVVIFSDLDGTLLNSKKEVGKANEEAIKKFINNGGTFAVATGRNEINTKNFVNNKLLNGPSILYNGSVVYDFSKEKYLLEEYISTESLKELFEYLLKEYKNIDVTTYNKGEINYITPFSRVHYDHYLLHAPCNFITLEELLNRYDKSLKVLLCGNMDELKEIENKIKNSKLYDEVDCVITSAFYLELLPKGINKGTILKKLKQINEYKNKTFIAIGDYYNDLELLTFADIPVCPSNAIDEVKKIASYQTMSCDENAISDLIINIIPKL